MDKQTTHANRTELTITLPKELQQQVRFIATQKGDTLSDVICLAVTLYITSYPKQHPPVSKTMSLNKAREVMRELGQGLGTGQHPHNGSRCHDTYLYGEK